MSSCAVEGCLGPAVANRLCSKHYLRLRRKGTTTTPEARPAIDRFMSFIEVEDSSGAWLWTGGRTGAGYGAFWVDGRTVGAHRFSYEHFVGAIPPRMFVCHRYESLGRHNVAPDHLFLGDHLDNMRDAAKKGRTLSGARNAQAKITDETAMIILESNSTLEDMASDHGISTARVSKIIRGAGWSHLGQGEAPANLPRHNRSGYRGVCWCPRVSKWRAAINYTMNGKKRYLELGRYSDPVEAAIAYDTAARKFHGSKAVTNFEG